MVRRHQFQSTFINKIFMKNLNLLLLALILLFSSCNGVPSELDEMEEEITEVVMDEEQEDSEGEEEENNNDEENEDEWDEDDEACFNFIYPISYEMPDGSILSGESEENLWASIEEWFELNGETDREIKLVYPVLIIFQDKDEVFTVTNDEELERMYQACEDDEHDDYERPCFKFIYPLSYELPDGTIVSVESLEEFSMVVREWFETHDEVDAHFALIFPVRIIFDDRDEILTIENNEALERVRRDCEDDEDDEDDNDDERYDCEELRANFGDPCRTDDGREGTINRDCECV